MSRLVNLVHVKVAEGYLDKIQDAMLTNARQSVLEENCHQFDVVVSQEDDHSFVFYEVYETRLLWTPTERPRISWPTGS